MKDLYPTRGKEEKMLDRVDNVVCSKSNKKYALKEDEVKFYEENGFIVFPEFFTEKEVGTLNWAFEELKKDPSMMKREEYITEPDSSELRSIFSQHIFSSVFEQLISDRRILDKVEQILGSKAYMHHSRINIKPAYTGKSFPWHSDFETWHAEDGLPRCRSLSAWIMLTDNTEFNGPLYLIPGSHKKFVACAGETPEDHYKESLKNQKYGVPSVDAARTLSEEKGLVSVLGKAGALVLHDGNILHGSPDNISPYSRTNAFFVYNSIENKPVKPFAAKGKRANFLCLKDFKAL